MFLDFRKIFQNEKARGWQVDKDVQGYYISKFDDNLNDDQFRFYLNESDNGTLEIVNSYRRKSTGKTKVLKKNHPCLLRAYELVDAYNKKIS